MNTKTNNVAKQKSTRRSKIRRRKNYIMIRRLFLVVFCLLVASTLIKIEENTRPMVVDAVEQTKVENLQEGSEQIVYTKVRYQLTTRERQLIEKVVMAEAGGESYDGQRAVAQCILNAAERDGIRPDKAIKKYKYTSRRKTPTESVKKAVSAVFDNGEMPINDTPLWFYAPAVCRSKWHESMRFVGEIGGHRFFAEWR